MSKLSLKEGQQLQGHRQFLTKIVAELGIMEEFEKPIFKENQQFIHTDKGLKIKDKEQTSLQEVGRCAAHLDGVTELLVSPNEAFSVTVSEDCLVKVWNHRSLFTDEQPEPIRSLREHKGPLFSLAGGLQSGKEYVFFTSGSEGLINAWKIPQSSQPEQVELTGSWMNDATSKEDDTVWQMTYQSNKLLTSSSDGVVRLFIENKEGRQGFEFRKQYSEKQFRQTAVEWLSEKSFMTGCQNAARITAYDLQGKVCQKYLYEVQKSRDAGSLSSQVNRLKYFSSFSLIAAGCEDDKLRLFDFNRGKVVKKLQVSASITAMGSRGEYQIVGGCRDSSLYLWDIRTFKLLLTKTNCHSCKYDAGIMCLSADRGGIVTGGADGIMKLFT